MNTMMRFIQEVFLMKQEDCGIGLSQFDNVKSPVETAPKRVVKPASEVKISDLMRRTY